jgi:capsular exopolysaccharide synthesis family protein
VFSLNHFAGLSDLLVGDVQSAEECMVRTETDNLYLITSGPIPPNPSELLGSKRMEAVLAEAQKNGELVILDTPPTLAVTDAAVLASKVDGVILLIEAQRTSHEAARRAYDALQRVGATILGVVLTKTKSERRTYYYYGEGERPTRRPILKLWLGRLAKSGLIQMAMSGRWKTQPGSRKHR